MGLKFKFLSFWEVLLFSSFPYNARMAKKKPTTTHHTFMTVELQNIIAGGILVILAAFMFLSTNEASIVGKYFSIF